MTQDVLKTIEENKIIAILRGIHSSKIVDLAFALSKGGIHCIEVTFDQSSKENAEDTLVCIKKIREALGENVCVGAGTVMSIEQVHLAYEAGAQYIISPNTDEKVIKETKKLGLVSIPGAMTPSEIANAHSLGADIIKVFPAGFLGPDYFKAVKAPLKHIPISAVGGITVENCASFIKAGAMGIGVSGQLSNKKLVDEAKFEEITKTAQSYVDTLKTAL